VLAGAKAQAKKALDEATARATAIHDGAERRLNLLSTRHAETIKRLSDILDGVSSLVAAETSRMSLEEEVDQATAKAISAGEAASAARPAGVPAGSNGPTAGNGPTAPNGPSGARPAAQSQAGPASSRPGAPAAGQPSAPAPSQGSTPSGPGKRPSARTGVLDSDEHGDGIRLVPGSDN
jgi:hypothetical protein